MLNAWPRPNNSGEIDFSLKVVPLWREGRLGSSRPLRQSHSSTAAILRDKLDAGLFEGLGDSRNCFVSHLDGPTGLCPLQCRNRNSRKPKRDGYSSQTRFTK
jgi:hypothetical protein